MRISKCAWRMKQILGTCDGGCFSFTLIKEGDMSYFFQFSEEAGAFLPKTSGKIFISLLLILALAVGTLSRRREKAPQMSAKQLAFSAVALALAVVTSNIKIWRMPMGGSVTLFSMFFVCLVGYLYGTRSGLMAGVAYGLLQLLIDPYVVGLPQLLLDYPVAFGALGLSGLFSDKKNGLVTGYFLGISGRFVISVCSGLLFFASSTPETMTPLLYSVLYNGGYIYGEGALTIILLTLPAVKKTFVRIKGMAGEPLKNAA